MHRTDQGDRLAVARGIPDQPVRIGQIGGGLIQLQALVLGQHVEIAGADALRRCMAGRQQQGCGGKNVSQHRVIPQGCVVVTLKDARAGSIALCALASLSYFPPSRLHA